MIPPSPARGVVGRVTDRGVRGLGFKSPGSILTSRTEASSLSRVVRDGWDPCSVPLSGEKKFHAVESFSWPLNSHNCSENYPKTNKKKTLPLPEQCGMKLWNLPFYFPFVTKR